MPNTLFPAHIQSMAAVALTVILSASLSAQELEAPVPGGQYAISVFVNPTAQVVNSRTRGGGDTNFTLPTRLQVLYIRVNFPDDLRDYCSESQAYGACRDVADFYAEQSYGNQQLAFDVTPLLTMPHTFMHYREAVSHVNTSGAGPLWGDAVVVAQAAGYNMDNYSRVVVAHRQMFEANNSVIQVQDLGASTLAHELGHTFGAGHANRWYADGRSAYGARDAQRFDDDLPTFQNYDLYGHSFIAYGDPWDTMASGNLYHFGVYYKAAFGWIPPGQIANITSSGRFRITAMDYPTIEADRIYGFKIAKNSQEAYWGGFRCRQVDGRTGLRFPESPERWLPTSLLLYGGPWDGSFDPKGGPSTVLLDTTPGSSGNLSGGVVHGGGNFYFSAGNADSGGYGSGPIVLPVDGAYFRDCGISVGRTFSDRNAGIHITVVDKVQSEPQALDVVVNLGTFPDNHAPTLTVGFSGGQTGSNGQLLVPLPATGSSTSQITFVATASDPDGDELAYFWDFGDYTNSSRNAASVTHAWSATDVGQGQLFVVRCVVSDMKGGVASFNIPVNIGLPEFPGIDSSDTTGRQQFYAKGHITDESGNPLEGIRVAAVSSPYRGGFTDSNGDFLIAGLAGNDVAFDAVTEDRRFVGVNNASPLPSTLTFTNSDFRHVDFVGWKRQSVTMAAESPTVSPGSDARFVLTRSVPLHGSFSTPAPWSQPIDFLAAPLTVRIYPSDTSVVTQWRVLPSGPWQNLALYQGIIVQTPEYPKQYRNESKNLINPAFDPNPKHDMYVTFPPGATQIEFRTPTSSTAPSYQTPVSMLAAFGVDYVAVPEEATTFVTNPAPATTPTVHLETDSLPLYGPNPNSDAPVASFQSNHPAHFLVVSDIPVPKRIVVPIAIGGGVNPAVDLINTPAQVVLEPGMTRAEINIWSRGNRMLQPNLSGTVNLGSGTGYNVGTPSSFGLTVIERYIPWVSVTPTITHARSANDDGSGTVSGEFTVSRSGDLQDELVVNLRSAGTAIPGADYLALPTTVTFKPGDSSVGVPVQPTGTSTASSDRTVVLQIASGVDYEVHNPGSAQVTLQSLKIPDVTLSVIGSATVSENNGTTTLRFTRQRITTGNLVVHFSLSGTVTYGIHYTLSPMPTLGRVTIPSGSDHADLTFKASGDLVREIQQEDNEYAFVQLQPDPAYNVLSGKDSASVTITDNWSANNEAAVTFEVPHHDVLEGNSFSIDIVLSDWTTASEGAAQNTTPSVDWAIVADTTGANPAVAGTNYLVDSGTANFPYFPYPATFGDQIRRIPITVTTLDDHVPGPDRTFLLVLSNPRNCTLPQVVNGSEDLSKCVVTIREVDTGTVSVTMSPASVPKGQSATLTVSRAMNGAAVAADLDVLLETSGTAVPGFNYQVFGTDPTPVNGFATDDSSSSDSTMRRQVHLAPSQLSLTIPIQTVDDGTVDPTLSLSVRVAAAGGYTLSTTPASLNILSTTGDYRPVVTVLASDPYANELGPKSGILTFTRTGSTAAALTVPIVVSPLSTSVAGVDYLQLPTSVTFPAGSAGVNLVVLPIHNPAVQDTHTVIVSLVAASSPYFAVGDQSSATVWIQDEDRAPAVVSVAVPIPTVWENAATTDGSVGRFLLSRTKEQIGPLSINVTLSGTAVNGRNYHQISNVIFPAGSDQVAVDVNPIPDGIPTGVLTVVLTVGPGFGYVPDPILASGTVDILDTEASTVGVIDHSDGNEATLSPVTFTCIRVGGDLSSALDVPFTIDPASTAASSQFTLINPAVAHFAAGQATATVSLPVLHDGVAEGDTTLILDLAASGSGFVAGDPASDTALILDADEPRASLALTTPSNSFAYKSQGGIGSPVPNSFTVTVTQAPSSDLTLGYLVSGTAKMGRDYQVLSGTVIIPAGQTTAVITITPIDDLVIRDPATVIVTLQPGTGFTIDSSADQATMTIISDALLRVAVISPPNHKVGDAFCGPLTYRFYRVGSNEGPLRINYSVTTLTTPAGTNEIQDDGSTITSLPGFVDLQDGQWYVDVPINFLPGYSALVRRTLTIQVDTPVISGTYVPGTIPGIPGGMKQATCQMLTLIDRGLVRIGPGAASITEGSGLDCTIAAETTFSTDQQVALASMPYIGPAQLGSAYTLSPTPPVTLLAGAPSVGDHLHVPSNYTIDGTRDTVLAAIQPTVVSGDPPYWVVGLPSEITILDGPPPRALLQIQRAGNIVVGTDSIPGLQLNNSQASYLYSFNNVGDLPLTITAIDIITSSNVITPQIVSLPALPQTLDPGQSITGNVLVTPQAVGPWSIGFRVTSNDSIQPITTWTLSGTAATQLMIDRANEGNSTVNRCGVGGAAVFLLVGGSLLFRRQRRSSDRRGSRASSADRGWP